MNPTRTTLHILAEADRDLILPWRNDPEVRRSMFSHQVISAEEHRAWFDRIHNDPDALWYLCRDASNEPVGVVSFTDISRVHRTANWGFYTRPDAQAGTGTSILIAALDHAFYELGLHKINGEVLDTNTVSLHLHSKCGFSQEGVFREHHFNGERYIDVVRFGLFAREWPTHKERLLLQPNGSTTSVPQEYE